MVIHKNIKQYRWIGLDRYSSTRLLKATINFSRQPSCWNVSQVGYLETFEMRNKEGRRNTRRKKQPHNGNQPNGRLCTQLLKDNSKQQGQQQDSRHHHLHPDNDVRPPKLRQQKLPKRRLSLRWGYTSRWLKICRKTLEEKNTYFLKKKVASRCKEDNRNQLVLNTLPAESLASLEENCHWGKDVTISVVGGFRSFSPWSCLELSTMEKSRWISLHSRYLRKVWYPRLEVDITQDLVTAQNYLT